MSQADTMLRLVTTGFRQLALACHPDHGGTDEEMRAVIDAKEELLRWISTGNPPDNASDINGGHARSAIVLQGDTVHITNVWAQRETKKALLIVVSGSPMWIPFSQINPGSDVTQAAQFGTITITRWIALQKGLI